MLGPHHLNKPPPQSQTKHIHNTEDQRSSHSSRNDFHQAQRQPFRSHFCCSSVFYWCRASEEGHQRSRHIREANGATVVWGWMVRLCLLPGHYWRLRSAPCPLPLLPADLHRCERRTLPPLLRDSWRCVCLGHKSFRRRQNDGNH